MSTANWIKLRVNIWEKPEVQYIADNCEIPVEYAVGMLCKVWTWFDQHTSEGITNKFGAKVLEKYTKINVTESCDNIVTLVTGSEIIVTPFLQSMIEVDWITLTNDGLWLLIYWSEHNGETAKGRAEATKRQVKSRDKKKKEKAKEEQKRPVTEFCDKSVTREEKRREEKSKKENKNTLVNPTDKPKAKNEIRLASYRKGFDQWWSLYDKKRHKSEALKYWMKLSEDEMKKAVAVVGDYTKANEKKYRTDPHRYLRDKAFEYEIILDVVNNNFGKPNSFTESQNPINRIDPKRLEGCIN
jgi:hypothetical protein